MLRAFKFPIVRSLFFCFLIMLYLVTNHLTVLAFFVIGGGYSLIESIMRKKNLDVATGKIWIDLGGVLIIFVTLAFVLLDTSQ
ncbi:hypothetical protein [Virgibacillus pantothenticus]|uniref:hypothetical protein n=1 Tax=Virgibacillus pantothenticus TaxID=1473 RepID=UPI0009842494|nr:hypothetical protein [Virgibacillus pantothenticus]